MHLFQLLSIKFEYKVIRMSIFLERYLLWQSLKSCLHVGQTSSASKTLKLFVLILPNLVMA